MSTHDVRLVGCRPEPLGSYLKALGVLRLVGEQADPSARGWWSSDTFMLRSRLDADEVVDFFVDGYQPTPLVSPWNEGSGFKTEKNPAAVAALRAIEDSTVDRLAPYRQAIAVAREIYAVRGDSDKDEVVLRCRNELPDEATRWIDATVVLTATKPSFPPLLGTGGNDGRFDFSKAFMERLADVLALRVGRAAPDGPASQRWAREALFASETSLLADAVGQFDPGAAGGANSSPLGRADSVVNPWDWVLLVEGALVFAAAAARRMTDARGRAAVPFTFDTTTAGYATAADETARGEVWAPLWSAPSTFSAIAHLIGEGRVDWRRHHARNGLDAARAVASLGVDRGIDRFVRYGLIERNGLATAAVTLGRHRPTDSRAVPIAAQLDPWLSGIRRASNPPPSVAAAKSGVDRALFEHASRPTIANMQRLLVSAALLEEAVVRSPTFRARPGVRPARGLVAREWLPLLDDRTPEFDVARALASQHDGDGASLRGLFYPIATHDGSIGWTVGSAPVTGLAMRPLRELLAAALVQRALGRVRSDRLADERTVGVLIAYERSVAASPRSVDAWLSRRLDERRVDELFRALLLLDWRRGVDHEAAAGVDETVPPAFALLAPFFALQPLPSGEREVVLRCDPAWPQQLAAGRVEVVLQSAVRRLRVQHRRARALSLDVVAASGPEGPALAAALSCPLSRRAVAQLARRSIRSSSLEAV